MADKSPLAGHPLFSREVSPTDSPADKLRNASGNPLSSSPLFTGVPRPEEPVAKEVGGFVKTFADLPGMAKGVAGLGAFAAARGAEAIGADGAADSLRQTAFDLGGQLAADNQEFTDKWGRVPTLKEVEDAGDFADWFRYAVGYGVGQLSQAAAASAAGAIAGTVVAPGIGTVVGGIGGLLATAAGKASLKRVIARKTMEEFSKQAAIAAARGVAAEKIGETAAKGAIIAVSKNLGRMAGVTAYTATQEFGSIFADATEKYKEDGTDPSLGRMLVGGLAATAIESWADAKLLGTLGSALGKDKGGLQGALIEGIKGFGREAVTEVSQTALERFGAQRDITSEDAVWDYIESGALGGVMGGGVGAISGAVRETKDAGPKPKKPDPFKVDPQETGPDIPADEYVDPTRPALPPPLTGASKPPTEETKIVPEGRRLEDRSGDLWVGPSAPDDPRGRYPTNESGDPIIPTGDVFTPGTRPVERGTQQEVKVTQSGTAVPTGGTDSIAASEQIAAASAAERQRATQTGNLDEQRAGAPYPAGLADQIDRQNAADETARTANLGLTPEQDQRIRQKIASAQQQVRDLSREMLETDDGIASIEANLPNLTGKAKKAAERNLAGLRARQAEISREMSDLANLQNAWGQILQGANPVSRVNYGAVPGTPVTPAPTPDQQGRVFTDPENPARAAPFIDPNQPETSAYPVNPQPEQTGRVFQQTGQTQNQPRAAQQTSVSGQGSVQSTQAQTQTPYGDIATIIDQNPDGIAPADLAQQLDVDPNDGSFDNAIDELVAEGLYEVAGTKKRPLIRRVQKPAASTEREQTRDMNEPLKDLAPEQAVNYTYEQQEKGEDSDFGAILDSHPDPQVNRAMKTRYDPLTNKQQGLLNRAVNAAIRFGLPIELVEAVQGWYSIPSTDLHGAWMRKAQVIAISQELLSGGARAAKSLVQTVLHEVGHVADVMDDAYKVAYKSWWSPEARQFVDDSRNQSMVDPDYEIRPGAVTARADSARLEDGTLGKTVVLTGLDDSRMGKAAREALSVWNSFLSGRRGYAPAAELTYPFKNLLGAVSKYSNAQDLSKDLLETQAELFAQVFSLYHTNRRWLKEHMPVNYAIVEKRLASAKVKRGTNATQRSYPAAGSRRVSRGYGGLLGEVRRGSPEGVGTEVRQQPEGTDAPAVRRDQEQQAVPEGRPGNAVLNEFPGTDSPLQDYVTEESARGRLNRRLKRKDEKGVPKTPRTVVTTKDGKKFAIGRITPEDWLHRNRLFLSNSEITDAREWYRKLHAKLSPIFGEELAPHVALAWLLSQQNASPSAGMMNVLRAMDKVLGKQVDKTPGLAADKLDAVLRGDVPKGGIGAKLLDFSDSELNLITRTVMRGDERGRQPAAIDVWAFRDIGFVDAIMMNWLRKEFGTQVASEFQTQSFGEAPYEYGIDFYNDVADYLNDTNFLGGGWLAADVQAVGWVGTQTMTGRKPEFVNDIIDKNSSVVSIGLAPGAGTAAQGKVAEIPADRAAKIVEELAQRANVFIVAAQQAAGAYLSDTENSLQVYVMGSPESVQDFMDMVGYALQQTEVIATRRKKSGNRSEITISHQNLRDFDTATDFWQAVRDNYTSDMDEDASTSIDGFRQLLAPDGTGAAVSFVNFGGRWSGEKLERILDAIEAASDEFGISPEVDISNVELRSTKNDWTTDRQGEAYLGSLRARGRLREAAELARKYVPSSDTVTGPANQQQEAAPAAAEEVAPQDYLASRRLTGNVGTEVPVFYSGLQKIVSDSNVTKSTGSQWLAYLKNRGVKQDELVWTGAGEWLPAQKSVTKEELLNYLASNAVEVEEVLKGGSRDGRESKLDALRRAEAEVEAAGKELDAAAEAAAVEWTNQQIAGADAPISDNVRRAMLTVARSLVFDRDNGIPPTPAFTAAQQRWRQANQEADRIHNEMPNDDTQYVNWQLPGGENYRELLLTLPSRSTMREDFEVVNQGRIGNGWILGVRNKRTGEMVLKPEATPYSPDQFIDKYYSSHRAGLHPVKDEFQSGHYDEPNVLAHVRFNDRTDADGKRVLFVEEIQSDWHQKGRKEGYQGKRAGFDILNSDGSVVVRGYTGTRENADKIAAQYPGGTVREREVDSLSGVPDAPFKTTWPDLALKRMIRWAAENGYDRIAWTPGEVQADRYDLSKQIERIEYNESMQGGRLTAEKNDELVIIETGVTPDKLESYIGKEAAKKLLDAPLTGDGNQWRVLDGVDLKVGGEGMRGFYDKILVDTANKLGKKFGAKVGRTTISIGAGPVKDETGVKLGNRTKDVHSLDITPQMRESALQGQPLFSRRAAGGVASEVADQYDEAAAPRPLQWLRDLKEGGLSGFTDAVIRKFQDKYLPVKRIEQMVAGRRGWDRVPDWQSAHMGESLMHGKVSAETEALERDYLEPIFQILRDNGMTIGDAGAYLYAKHAPERNAYIREINPSMPDGGSGMTDAEAQSVIDAYRQDGKFDALEQISGLYNQMMAEQRQRLVDFDLEDPFVVGSWLSRYSNYVPLKGLATDESNDTRMRTGRGLGMSGREAIRALGRLTIASNPFAQGIQDAHEKIFRARRNEVAKRFLNLVRANPDQNLWKIIDENHPEYERYFNESRRQVEWRKKNMVASRLRGEDVFSVKMMGKTVYVDIFDESLKAALLNENEAQYDAAMQGFISTLGRVNNWLSGVNTRWNPVWTLTNAPRDFIAGLLNIVAEQDLIDGLINGKRIVQDVAADVAKGRPHRALWRRMSGTQGQTAEEQEWDAYANEFFESGAATGWVRFRTVDEQQRHLRHQMYAKKYPGVHQLEQLKNAMEHFNDVIENGMRLSTYANARRAGVSRDKAATLAKQVTINFNRRGEMSTVMNSFYLFFNASVQGTAQFARTMQSKEARKLVYALAGLGAASAVVMATMMDDDEWEKIPEHVKERNLLIPIGGDLIKIPLPYQYSAFSYAAMKMTEVAMGKEKAPSAVWKSMGKMIGDATPIRLPEGEGIDIKRLRGLAPTAVQPFGDLIANRNYFGEPISRERFPGESDPNSQMGLRSTPTKWKQAAQLINAATGGTDNISGLIDPHPEILKYLFEYALGGVGRTLSLYGGSLEETGNPLSALVKPISTPVFYQPSALQNARVYYDNITELKQIKAEWDSLLGAEKAEFFRKHKEEIGLANRAKTFETRLRSLQRQRRIAEESSMAEDFKDERVDAIEKRLAETYDQFAKEWREATRSR